MHSKLMSLVIALALLALCAAQSTANEPPPADTPAIAKMFPGTPQHLDSSVVWPDESALSDEGLFTATVIHGGGCESHAYPVNVLIDGDVTSLWVEHQEPVRDLCEALLHGNASLQLSPEALASKSIVLVGPNGQSATLK